MNQTATPAKKSKLLKTSIIVGLLILVLFAIFFLVWFKESSSVHVGETVTLHINEMVKVQGTHTYIRLSGFSCIMCEVSACNQVIYETSEDGVNFTPLDENKFAYWMPVVDMDCKTFVAFRLEKNLSKTSP